VIVGDEPDIKTRLARLAAPQPCAGAHRDAAAVCVVTKSVKIRNSLRA